jgi:hypothetical protein
MCVYVRMYVCMYVCVYVYIYAVFLAVTNNANRVTINAITLPLTLLPTVLTAILQIQV